MLGIEKYKVSEIDNQQAGFDSYGKQCKKKTQMKQKTILSAGKYFKNQI